MNNSKIRGVESPTFSIMNIHNVFRSYILKCHGNIFLGYRLIKLKMCFISDQVLLP